MRMNLFIILILGLILYQTNIFAQRDYANKVNQLNIDGRKEGLWTKEDKGHKYFMYYSAGTLNGPYYIVNTAKNVLSGFGEYLNGEYSGTWYSFGDYGHLMMMQYNFEKNEKPIPSEHHSRGTCPFRCYSINYYPNGNKKSEGILLWDEDPESDSTFEYGEWRYYDENQNLIKIKVFK